MKNVKERGQATLITVLAMGLLLVGALGLAIDGGSLYGHRQMAQAAADAAAQAAILSIFNGTNTGTNAFGSTAYTCSSTDATTPCVYARKHGFGTADDTVSIDYPSAASIGLDPASLSTSDPVNVLRVRVTRNVHSTFMKLLGAANTTAIQAQAAAAIVSVMSPVPLLITHPSLPNSLSTNGTTDIQICGGPTRSVQVNSSSLTAFASPKAGGLINLAHAGPNDPGNCTTGTGADFGVFGGSATNPGSVDAGSTGRYRRSSPIQDPLAFVPAPSPPPVAPAVQNVASPNWGCVYASCRLYSPGKYVGGLNISGGTPILFKPGLYYMEGGGFTLKNVDGGGGLANSWNAMCVGCTADADTGTGMVVYDTGPAGSTPGSNPTGGFDINTLVQVSLQGSDKTTTNPAGETVPAPPYYGIIFWEDRDADTHNGVGSNKAHSLGQGNGCFTLVGTIYATNWLSTMQADPNHYQAVEYNGTPCSNTYVQGNIIVSSLQIVGTTTIRMKLVPYGYLEVRQVALVK